MRIVVKLVVEELGNKVLGIRDYNFTYRTSTMYSLQIDKLIVSASTATDICRASKRTCTLLMHINTLNHHSYVVSLIVQV